MKGELFPKTVVVEGKKDWTFFSSEPTHRENEGLSTIEISIGNFPKLFVQTSDPDFTKNPHYFFGEISIQHDPAWACRLDLFNQGMKQVHFRFLKVNGRNEALVAYIDEKALSAIAEWFNHQ